MHNFNFTRPDTTESIKSVRYRTGQRKSDFLDKNGDLLVSLHEGYNTKADSDMLSTLTPQWTKPGKKEDYSEHEYWVSYDLYESNLKYVSDYWDKLKNLNGGKTLKCPICGLSDCREMDHFAPRSVFPEYSCHLPNLIPLCHNCNNDKGDAWLDRTRNQIFFNAFFDTDIPESIVECGFETSADLIKSRISLSTKLKTTNSQHVRIISTITRLKLLPKFQEEADKVLNRHIRDLKCRYTSEKARYKDISEYLTISFKIIGDCVNDDATTDFIEKEVDKAMINDVVFRDYITRILMDL